MVCIWLRQQAAIPLHLHRLLPFAFKIQSVDSFFVIGIGLRIYNFSFDFKKKQAQDALRAKLMTVDRTFETESNEYELKDWIWYDCAAALPVEILCAFFGMRYWNVVRVMKLVRTINLPVYLKGTLILREKWGK